MLSKARQKKLYYFLKKSFMTIKFVYLGPQIFLGGKGGRPPLDPLVGIPHYQVHKYGLIHLLHDALKKIIK